MLTPTILILCLAVLYFLSKIHSRATPARLPDEKPPVVVLGVQVVSPGSYTQRIERFEFAPDDKQEPDWSKLPVIDVEFEPVNPRMKEALTRYRAALVDRYV